MTSTYRRLHWMSVLFPDDIDFPGNDEGLIVPSGSTAERPTSPVNGFIRYNTNLNQLESYVNGNWENLLSTVASITEFINLTDTFNSYSGRNDQLVVVDASGTSIVSVDGDTLFIPLSGSIMDAGANITVNGGGEFLGLPPVPTTANAATSKAFVENLVGPPQSWSSDLSPSGSATRAVDAPYTNTTGYPMTINIIVQSAAATVSSTIEVDGQVIARNSETTSAVGDDRSLTAVIPNGASYKVAIFPLLSGIITDWYELS